VFVLDLYIFDGVWQLDIRAHFGSCWVLRLVKTALRCLTHIHPALTLSAEPAFMKLALMIIAVIVQEAIGVFSDFRGVVLWG